MILKVIYVVVFCVLKVFGEVEFLFIFSIGCFLVCNNWVVSCWGDGGLCEWVVCGVGLYWLNVDVDVVVFGVVVFCFVIWIYEFVGLIVFCSKLLLFLLWIGLFFKLIMLKGKVLEKM